MAVAEGKRREGLGNLWRGFVSGCCWLGVGVELWSARSNLEILQKREGHKNEELLFHFLETSAIRKACFFDVGRSRGCSCAEFGLDSRLRCDSKRVR